MSAAIALRLDRRRLVASRDGPLPRRAAAELMRLRAAAGLEPAECFAVDAGLAARAPERGPVADGETVWFHAADGPTLLSQICAHAEALGWRWYAPGPLGEVLRRGVRPDWAAPNGVREVAVRDHGESGDHSLAAGEARQLAAWLPRLGVGALTARHAAGELGDGLGARTVASTGEALDLPIRDLGRPLGDPLSPANQEALRQVADRSRRSPCVVLLRDLDPVAMGNLLAPRTRGLAADPRALDAAGASAFVVTTRGRISWWGTPLNAYVLLRCCRQPGLDGEALVADACAGLFGSAASPLRRWLDQVEATMAPLWWLRTVADTDGRREPADGDRLEDQAAALDELADLRRGLAEALHRADDSHVRLRLEAALAAFDLTYLHLQAWLLRLEGRLGARSLALHAGLRETLSQLRSRLDRLPGAPAAARPGGSYRRPIDAVAAWCGLDAPPGARGR